jgi:methylenetetrahydrofolate dehydrogenase (NADP+)/methenyltetrahydrofolate cyclohydrolase
MPELLEGKKVAESIYSKILLEISLLPFVPKITFVRIGDDPASASYVKSKGKKAGDLGLQSENLHLPAAVSEDELLAKIHALNRNKDVQGILVQLPLPKNLNKYRVMREIDPLKDVDGLNPENMGRLFQGDPRFIPCTPAGILEIFSHYSIPLEGTKAVVVGRSDIVGKPVAQLLLMHNATVTICHSKTRNLKEETRQADLLIVAMGKPKFIGADMVKEGATVVDVGIHRVGEKMVGDVDFDSVSPKVKYITPVPGGVGPMTIAMLMKNLVSAAALQARLGRAVG